ncbi:MAG: PBECR4 domain-containing protein [bacterium]|nr:PBECR4 domain-containing protein [bacterium]
MDKLQLCAKAFQKLLEYEYHFIIGQKRKLREFYLNFDKADFHHLSGLHKLKDIAQIQQGRIFSLSDLEKMLDDNQMIFRYNEKVNKFSLI